LSKLLHLDRFILPFCSEEFLHVNTKRLAAMDIGTNSIRCIVVEADHKGGYKVLDDEKSTVRLGEDLSRTGAISLQASARALEAVGRFRKLIEGLKVRAVEAIATSAMRRASNGLELLDALSTAFGHEIRIISGVEEAELAMASAQRHFDMEYKRYAVFDIGGGSLEITTALGNHIEECYSLDLGAVVMTEQFLSHDPARPADLQKLQRHVRTSLKKYVDRSKVQLHTLIGSGGTTTAIGSMAMNALGKSYASIHGYEVLRSEIVHMLAMLIRKNLAERRLVPGLNADRADIIVAGIVVVEELMRFFGANQLLVNERGIREGLIIKAMEKHGLVPVASVPRSWRDSALEFVRSCHGDEPHSQHVAHLALSLFDALAVPFNLKKSDRKLLEAAAILHDVGYFIAYSSHHKHSYHLIRHAELFGFTPREREIIAQIARYHRKSLPKRKHETFQALHEEDQQRVGRLGGILRLADGLDRRRSSAVQSIACEFGGTTVTVRLSGTDDMSLELFGATAKKDLFEKAFGTQIMFVTQPGM
jgi:exopolyphosphatase/guanosine-5'-triphosphate,3'-diphosphate pyrophosphatase